METSVVSIDASDKVCIYQEPVIVFDNGMSLRLGPSGTVYTLGPHDDWLLKQIDIYVRKLGK